ncbi:MAG TPA: extracellular solute-binding protein [Spirochaetales bacterium]|nr:extracellular solute-binding protein [Spirochaetales bacterium]HRY54534.1 extracellular solute-binding protein [Spirochaetia bacterium]
MNRFRPIAAALIALLALSAFPAFAEKVSITYWQYFYQSKVDLMNQLIENFEKANPDIDVEQVTFPYESYQQKVAAAIPAGEGPDVVNLFYGWLPLWVKSGYIQALPQSDFSADYFKKGFYPFVAESVNFGGKNYSVPTAVRTLALIYNKRLFREAGLDPAKPPKTLEELAAYAKKLSKYDAKGNLVQAGLLMQPNGQGHVWIREVLFRQFGATPYSADGRKVTYADAKGAQAFKWYTDLVTKDKVGYPNFSTDDVTAFKAQVGAMNVDGSFRIATLNAVKDLEWGVAELPSYKGVKSNFASFWTHSIASGVEGKKLEASVKFLKYITSAEVQELWLQKVGELPATPSLSAKYKADPVISVFLNGLGPAHATSYVDEAGQRAILVDAVDEVNLKGGDPAAVLKAAAAKEQKLIDDFWK